LQPKDGRNDVDHGGEAWIQSFHSVWRCVEALHPTEEIFDEMTPLVFVPVMRGVSAGALARRGMTAQYELRQARNQ
jgi:hypothetical protein